MKKIIFLGSAIASLLMPARALAQATIGTIQIDQPEKGFKSLSNAISNIITIVLAIGVIMVLVMIIWGAFEWITSGGDKEAVGKARGKIINALIGLVVLAVAFAIARLGGQIAGFDIFNISIPTPGPAVPGKI